ncbi:MAG: SpoIIE family protein phosphatase [Parachlamydiaceae bacterium]|nr:SpoIIE family protein phosphatase [Parachlamydiaceae bacterium]
MKKENLESFVIPNQLIVLLVDDQAIIGEAIRRLLSEEKDIEFHYCSNPEKAIEIAEQIHPTVILQDLVMPEFDGLTLVKYFRAHSILKNIPIIVLSTKEDPRIKAEAFAIGANDYIVKLPDKIELIARIRYHSKSYIHLLERNEAFRRLKESQDILNSELAEAASYVRSLLPPPLNNQIKTDWIFIPSTELGGDAFGYHWLDKDHFAIYLLDVCGHGVGAALLSISVINFLRSETLINTDFKNPSSVLIALNEVFQMEKQNNMFFTIWYGVFNANTNQLTYANGGHPPAILISEGQTNNDKVVKYLKPEGVAIGIAPEGFFSNETCKIESNNVLYLFSDGVYELNNQQGEIGTLDEFVKYLIQYENNKESYLDEIVQHSRLKQGESLFSDDYSILRVSFEDLTKK